MVFYYLCSMKVAFTGHRTYSTSEIGRLEAVIKQLYSEGYTHFISGMAEGFDLAAAECIIRLKADLKAIKLECAIPFEGHIQSLSASDRERYKDICSAADKVTTLANERQLKAYFDRNDYLCDNADAVVCYYSGKRRSGTGYTVNRAIKRGLRIINLYADGVQIQFFG